MDITINFESPTAVYQQIVQQVRESVISNQIAPGTFLPPIRQLAVDLEINPNTVAKAYQILEGEGITESAGRKGTFIKDSAQIKSMESIERKIIARLDEVLLFGTQNGFTPEDLLDLFNISIQQVKAKSS